MQPHPFAKLDDNDILSHVVQHAVVVSIFESSELKPAGLTVLLGDWRGSMQAALLVLVGIGKSSSIEGSELLTVETYQQTVT